MKRSDELYCLVALILTTLGVGVTCYACGHIDGYTAALRDRLHRRELAPVPDEPRPLPRQEAQPCDL